jgi:hypothetical protein
MPLRYSRAGFGFAVIVLLALASAPAAATTLVYVNRCAGGCTFSEGPNDSVANTSPIVDGSGVLSAFAHGDAVFAATVDCIASGLSRYDVQVVSADPSPTPHSEIVMAGLSQQIGLPTGVWAVAPSTCSYVPDAPAFVFANAMPADAQRLCWIGMQQLGFMAGLEHLFYCPDVMSTIEGCSDRSFQDRDSACGTTSPMPCQCGGTSRNSHSVMSTVFGAGDAIFADGFEAAG